MALDKNQLKSDIKSVLNELKTATDQDAAIEQYADKLSTAIDTYVKTASITYITGLVAPGGAVSGTFNGNLE